MSSTIPTLDLTAQYRTIEAEVLDAVHGVLASQRFILGPEVEALEQEMAQWLGCSHAIGVSSGTDALLAALMALDVGPGDEVVTTPFTFFATAGAVHRLGATPVFADIDPVTYNLDPVSVARVIGPRCKALIPVHLFGRAAPMEPLLALAMEHDLAVIEDAAQSIGADYDGAMTGTLGDTGCISFFPSKNLGGIGDGGMVTTQDSGLAKRLRCLRAHGAHPKYVHHEVGGNFRLDAVNAAVLRVKLRHLAAWNEARRRVARTYDELLGGLVSPDGPLLALPAPDDRGSQVFHQYVLRATRRDDLADFLRERGIHSAVYYPHPLHLQACFASLGYTEGDLPVTERATAEVLALPMFPELTHDQQRRVAETIGAFYRTSTAPQETP